MAYKDEYEVARLHTDPKFWERLNYQFDGDFKVKFHLGSPLLLAGKDAQGRPKKRTFGKWLVPFFKVLARMKGLRGTAFDPFGWMEDRRIERALVDDYRAMMSDVLAKVNQVNLSAAIELAGAALEVRGYGPVKVAAYEEYKVRKNTLLAAFERVRPVQKNQEAARELN